MSGGVLQAAAWDSDGSWSTSAKPVTDDPAVVSDELGDTAIVTDASGSAKTIELDVLQTHPRFNGQFGSSGSPIQTAAELLQVYGGGGFYFECSKNAGSAFSTDRLEIACADPNTPVEIGGVAADAGDLIESYCLRGNILFKGGSSKAMFDDTSGRIVVGQIESDRDAKVVIDTNADTLPYLDVKAGTVIARNIVTNLTVAGGVCVKDIAKASVVDIFGGILFYDHEAISGDATIIRVHAGGMLHMWRNALIKTITKVILLPGSTIVRSTHSKLHTITTEIDMGARRIHSEGLAQKIADRAFAR